MNEMVTVIMPSYNTGGFISDSIQSVIDQTYENWELIIVDDCSTDNTIEVIKSFDDPRIKLFINEKNAGAAFSRNYALREAKGKWIAFLDSDDLWMKNKLKKQINFMNRNHYHFSYTNYSEIDSEGKKTGVTITGPKRIRKTGFFNYCWPGCLTVMYDADYIGLIQIPDLKKNNDYAMWLKVCKKTDCFLLDEDLALYRRGRIGSISTNDIRTLMKWHYILFRDSEGEMAITALLNTARNMIFGLYKKVRYSKKGVAK